MAQIVDSIEINRTPEDVFAYLDELGKHGEWQEQIISVHVETDGPTRVGSRATDKRRLPGGTRDISYEITEHAPPRKSSFRGVNGSIRPLGTVTIEPLEGGARSKLTLEFELKGRGLGVLFAPLARANARKEIPKSHQRLKEILERTLTR
ncbi:MAG: hypothetical protein QOK11_558 [Pseudonocardiales bacterium]|nr:hypothetical protein [Pseudonocardiales bacterium]